ncbi:MAG TPA: TlpA disulfide reductase family protein [Candidatus Sulfotelmatobacter sp.]|nr:TlpA disulfide reductase family protein [Candidatus Sulfotelmatobacter sp.]
MKEKLFIAALILAAVAGFYVFTHSHSHSGIAAVKDHPLAPDFTLPQLDGQQLRLSSYRGKVVLLDFWATWCVPCREETPHFVELQQKYADHGLQIIGVSMDDGPEPVRSFYQQFHMNYPVAMGNAKTGELYGGVLGLPIAFLIGRDGRIAAKYTGATGAAVFEKAISRLLQTQ